MGDSHSFKPGSRPGGTTPPAKTSATDEKPAATDTEGGGQAGRIVHDERGNAIWSWIKETSRIAIDSTTHLLKKLEVPELKMEDTQNHELRIESERDPGGGYDPYGGSTGSKASGRGSAGAVGNSRGVTGATRGGTGSNTVGGAGGSSRGGTGSNKAGSPAVGGGYDPYGKSVTKKPGR